MPRLGIQKKSIFFMEKVFSMITNEKLLVLFGSGHIAEKTLSKKPAFIVDNNPDLQGSIYQGLEVKSPKVLAASPEMYEVIICTTSVSEVRNQLISMGFVWGKNVFVSEYLEERLEIADLEDELFECLISSGLPSTTTDLSGGGVFRVKETEDPYPVVQKIYSGNTHGLIRYNDGFAVTSQGEGIILFSHNLEIKAIIPLPKNIRVHGLRNYGDNWIVASSYEDCIICLDPLGNELFRYEFSDKYKEYGSAQHHCNDLVIVDDYAYVSMFSVSGNWKRGRFDGGIVEVNLKTGAMHTIISSLTMPHNVDFRSGNLLVLNSFKGQLLMNDFKLNCLLPGFVRGYDETRKYRILGESKNRNFSRLDTGRSPVSIDSRITIVHKDRKFSRSIPLPKTISEIHAISVLVPK